MTCITSYWALEPHFGDGFPALEETKSKFFSAMSLVNHSKPEQSLQNNCNCADPNCTADKRLPEALKIEIKPEITDLSSLQSPSLQSVGSTSGTGASNNEKNRPYKCLQCGKGFLLKHHLSTHEKIHTGERPHACPHCGKSFTHKYCLNTHLLLHSNERPYECLQCKKKFTLKHHLITHERVHLRSKPFICEECGKSFPLKKQLITHEKYHRGERPFVCKECGDCFAQENHLVMHLRFHGSLTSFICNQCGATFTRKFELVNHERVHGKEPLSCPTCHKEFLQKRTLLAHVKLHDIQNSKTCLHCGENFDNEKFLIAHQATVHCYEEKSTQNFLTLTNRLSSGGTGIIDGSKNYESYNDKAVKEQDFDNGSKSVRTSKQPKVKKFFCDICFRKFSSKHGLTQHKNRQHQSITASNVAYSDNRVDINNKSYSDSTKDYSVQTMVDTFG